ncbi:MAG: hypothetical protein Q4G35_04200 [Propionibacteriaceae bacterium]|nr:hypothetical protein [Propionibacteriaceae bacterium]
MNPEITSILNSHLVITPSEHPHLGHSIEHYRAKGQLVRVLGDAYSTPAAALSFEARVAAARAVYPNCVFVRETAARLTFKTSQPTGPVQVAAERRQQSKGFAFERRSIPDQLVRWDGQHYMSSVALTVLDLTDTLGSEAITDALRQEIVTVEQLTRALDLTKGRRGNQRRAQLVRQARQNPWSPLEVDGHLRLRKAHIDGWVANHPVVIKGERFYVDLAIPEIKLAVEVDGWTFHNSHGVFVSDRRKWNLLTLDGWTVLHFTATTMEDLVPQMQQAITMLSTR